MVGSNQARGQASRRQDNNVGSRSNSSIDVRNPNIKYMDERTIVTRNLKYITKAARVYKEFYCTKDITYVYTNEFGQDDELTIRFLADSFMHMCGVKEYKGLSARMFYSHAVKGKIQANRLVLITPEHFDTKVKALRKLKELSILDNIGVVNHNVVYRQYDFGQMIRTKEDLISIGTVEDKDNNKVPLTLINIPLSQNRLKAAMRGFCPVKEVRIVDRDIHRKQAN